MNNENIEFNVKLTEEIIEEYYSKMNVLKQSNIITSFIIMLVGIIFLWYIKEIELSILFIGFLLAYILIIILQQSKSKKIFKELLKNRMHDYKYIITEGNIKITCEDEEIKNKVNYKDISLVCENNNLIIILYDFSTKALLLPKNSLNQEQIDKIKEILSNNIKSDKLKFNKQNTKYSLKKKNIKIFKYISIVLIAIIFVAIVFTYTEETDYVPDYNNFINQQSYKYFGTKEIFPKEIPQSAKMINYYFYYKYKIINLNPSYQVCLEYTLDENDFNNEINRLQNFEYDTKNFKYPAYVLVPNNPYMNEYVIVKENEKKLIYIFLQEVNKRDINLKSEYLPNSILE